MYVYNGYERTEQTYGTFNTCGTTMTDTASRASLSATAEHLLTRRIVCDLKQV